jgi:hypothetical protein
MAKKISPKMKAWLKFGYKCRKDLGIKPFKKSSPGQKRKLVACVTAKARTIGIKMAGK